MTNKAPSSPHWGAACPSPSTHRKVLEYQDAPSTLSPSETITLPLCCARFPPSSSTVTPKLTGTPSLPQDLPGEGRLQPARAGGRKHGSLSQAGVAVAARQQGAELQAQPVPGTTTPRLRDKQPWPSNELPQFLLAAVLWSSVLNNSGELLNGLENTSRSVLMSSPRTCCPGLSLHHHRDAEQAQAPQCP